jgi:cytochrome c-type biogenesis protein CcmE
MTARQKRMLLVAGIVAGVGLAALLITKGFMGNVMYSYNPTEIAAGKAPPDKRFRLAGMVEKGSIDKTPGSLDVKFLVTDFRHTLRVNYSGILPDLFREGQGVIAHGRMHGDVFVADEILAKHDEKYMPPEVAKALKDNPPPPNVPRQNDVPLSKGT